MSKYLGVSTTLMSQVLSGEKTFTSEQAQGLKTYLGLTGLESDYLSFLVQYERSGTTEVKKYWKNKLGEIREQSLKISTRLKIDRNLNEQERSVFYSTPLFAAIRLFTSVGEKGKSLNEICARFEISRNKATEMLKFLVETGLCREENSKYFLGAQKTHLEQGSPHLLRHHSNWRIRAIRSSEDLSEKELMFTSVVSVAQKDFDRLRENMAVFIKSFLDEVHASPAEEIACFNLDFFWVKK